MKTALVFLIVLLFTQFDSKAQIDRLALSSKQTIEQKIGLTDITIEYSRPLKRGRKIFGELVPFNQIWRTGANRNTTIEFSEDVLIDNKKVAKGKYAIFTVPSKGDWDILLYTDTSNWDVPANLDSSKIAASIRVPSKMVNQDLEALTITIGDYTNYNFELLIGWSNVMVSVPFDLQTREQMDKKISRVLEGPSYSDYYSAALYQMESGKDYEKGLEWINKGLELSDKPLWWDLRIKANMLMELGRKDEALQLAKEGLQMAQKEERAFGINEFKTLIKQLEK